MIYTDNSDTIKQLLDTNTNKPIIQEIRHKVTKLNGKILICYSKFSQDKNYVHLRQLTIQAIELEFADTPQYLEIKDIQNEINRKIYNHWNTLWNDDNNISTLRKIKQKATDKNPTSSMQRKDQIVIMRLRIGHTKITYQHLMNKEKQKVCEQCNTKLTVKHISVASMASGGKGPPDRILTNYYKCHPQTKVGAVLCLVCVNFFHTSEIVTKYNAGNPLKIISNSLI